MTLDNGSTPNDTTSGTIRRNELDTHANTCCAGANWKVIDWTQEICEVTPFLGSYEPVKEIPVARCGMVWTSPHTGAEYLLVGNQMSWFGTQLDHSLINPNQIRENGLPVYDNPFGGTQFGIDADDVHIPFDTTGTIVHFESCVPTDWELKHLPIILLTAETWDPTGIQMGIRNQEEAEMRMIRTLTSGMKKSEIAEMHRQHAESRTVMWGQVEEELDKLSPVYNHWTFCKQLISAVNIATVYHDDVDAQEVKCK